MLDTGGGANGYTLDGNNPNEPASITTVAAARSGPSEAFWTSVAGPDPYSNFIYRGVGESVRSALGDEYLAQASDWELRAITATSVIAGVLAGEAVLAYGGFSLAAGWTASNVGIAVTAGAAGGLAEYGALVGTASLADYLNGGEYTVNAPTFAGAAEFTVGGALAGGLGFVGGAAGRAGLRAIGGELGGTVFGAGLRRSVGRGEAISRGAVLRAKHAETFGEYVYFRNQGFSPDEAKYLTELYPSRLWGLGRDQGHHFPITQATARDLGLPNWLRDSRFNVLSPRGISRGRFYELHYMVDPSYPGSNFPRHIGGGWWGRQLGLEDVSKPGWRLYPRGNFLEILVVQRVLKLVLERYSQLTRWWHATPGPTKVAGGGVIVGGGTAGGYWFFGGDDEQ